MKHSSFELTPQQKGMLASLLSETGESAPAVLAAIAKALEEFQEEAAACHMHSETNNHEVKTPARQDTPTPIWERIRETFSNLSEEDVNSLPADGAAQVDHYAYGLPKR